jgi:hypothetical protein
MNRFIFALLGFVVISSILLCQCGPVLSKNSLFREGETFYDARLLGTWVSTGTAVRDTVEFARLGEKLYQAIFKGKGTATVFIVDLGKVGQHMFLDAEPARTAQEQGWVTHSFYKVRIGKNRLTIAHLEEDWLRRMLKSGKVNLSHKLNMGKIVLTAPTDSLQWFVTRYAQSKDAFPKPTTLVRKM